MIFFNVLLRAVLLGDSSSVDVSCVGITRPLTTELAFGQNMKNLEHSDMFKLNINSTQSELCRLRYELTKLTC